MDLQRLQKQFIERLEAASGKPVILQSDPKFAGHSTIKIATKKYPIQAWPGEYSGLHLISIMYAAFQQFAPDTDVGIDLSKEYRMAASE